MTAYMLVDLDVHDLDGFKEYQSVSITGHPYARNYAEMFLK